MSPSHLFEPTYQRIRQRLMTGAWPAGMRLEATRIALDLGVSVSPVRDGFNRLAGERMIDARSGEGFHVPRFDGQGLRDLLDLNQMLLMTALMRSKPRRIVTIADGEDYATHTARLFHHLAQHSKNAELVALVDNISDRLHSLRRIDASVLADAQGDLVALETGLASADTARDARVVLRHYHERRRRAADRLVRALPAI